ncbi:hypothetical protein [Bradyrhizobium icense]|nr:hypothetical protein [Bradyrhizobium icense]
MRFPKMNSFVGDRHPLAEIGEFSGRLRVPGVRLSCGINLECGPHSIGRRHCRVEKGVAGLEDVFSLIGCDEFAPAEERYLPNQVA